MATSSSADLPLLISSENASSERRISPSWTVSQLKSRLEPITGIPASCQRLVLKVGAQAPQAIEAQDEDIIQLASWPLQSYAEISVGSEISLSLVTYFQTGIEYVLNPKKLCPSHPSRFIAGLSICQGTVSTITRALC